MLGIHVLFVLGFLSLLTRNIGHLVYACLRGCFALLFLVLISSAIIPNILFFLPSSTSTMSSAPTSLSNSQ